MSYYKKGGVMNTGTLDEERVKLNQMLKMVRDSDKSEEEKKKREKELLDAISEIDKKVAALRNIFSGVLDVENITFF
jgi:CRISPR/Cas system-associated endonuclease Cas3-HD